MQPQPCPYLVIYNVQLLSSVYQNLCDQSSTLPQKVLFFQVIDQMGQIPMKKWADICKPRGKGGLLGLRRMRNFNNALLAKLGRECLDRNFYSIPKAYSIFCLWKHICDSRNLIKRASCDSLQFSSCKQILQIFLVWFCLKQKKHRFYYPNNNAYVITTIIVSI